MPPSLVATALLLQAHDKVSDAEAKQRADFDIRCKVALGVAVEDRPFAKSPLQLFRAQLILHDRVRADFQHSLQFARQTGYLKGRLIKVAVDTTYILGRGHLQPASRRHRPGGEGAGGPGWDAVRGVSQKMEPGPVFWHHFLGKQLHGAHHFVVLHAAEGHACASPFFDIDLHQHMTMSVTPAIEIC